MERLQEWGEQVGKPSYKAFPSGTFLIFLFGEQSTVQLVVVEHVTQFSGCLLVEDKGVYFIVITQASAVQVGASYCTEQTVHHHDFRVMESAAVNIDFGSFLA